MGVSYFTAIEMRTLLGIVLVAAAAKANEDGACYSHLNEKCESPGEDWAAGSCNSIHGGFRGNSDNLHRIIIDDFEDSMNYLIMSSTFSTDKTNRMGFSNYFMDQSDGHDQVCSSERRKNGGRISDSSIWHK